MKYYNNENWNFYIFIYIVFIKYTQFYIFIVQEINYTNNVTIFTNIYDHIVFYI